jgi:hypothetical protein
VDYELAKQWFVQELGRLHTELNEIEASGDEPAAMVHYGDSGMVEPFLTLDVIGEALWGCHEAVPIDAKALEDIGLQPEQSFHEAVLTRHLNRILATGDRSQDEEISELYQVFLRDQVGRQQGKDAPLVDRATFHTWLREHVLDGDKLAQADETP